MDDLNLTDNPTMGSIIKLTSDVAGEQLSYDFGGRRIYIPHKVGVHHPIAVSIGLEEAKKICDAWGGLDFDVPMSMRKRKAAFELKKSGHSVSQIAEKLTCTERTVYNLLRKNTEQTNQLNLF